MLQVSPHFLEQTLDKKLMSDLRVSIWNLFCIITEICCMHSILVARYMFPLDLIILNVC